MVIVFGAIFIAILDLVLGANPIFAVVMAGIAWWILNKIPDEKEEAKDKAEIAKYQAEAALHNQKARLAAKDAPIEVAAQIALMQAEAEIKLWAEKGNAEKVLEFTKKKHELEKELGRIQ